MQYNSGDLIDNRFFVTGICSDSGGMGGILHVNDTMNIINSPIVLKYCKVDDDEYIKRFKREVRLLSSFPNNGRVIQVLYGNMDSVPPYFIMPYYERGDLTKFSESIKSNYGIQEFVFYSMIDAISELHNKSILHRDIKPQNFLVDHQGQVIVSDFGLGMEPESISRFTSSGMFWGTRGYLPPEFSDEGFKHATVPADIFMLGKSFYNLLTGRDPGYLIENVVHPSLFYVINRCCEMDPQRRFQSLAELKQALTLAYDVVLNRGGKTAEAFQMYDAIVGRLTSENKFDPKQISDFLAILSSIDGADQKKICSSIRSNFMKVLSIHDFNFYMHDFLRVYQSMVDGYNYSFEFAEVISSNMKILFDSTIVSNMHKGKALDIAIDSATYMNRFAAMDTCKEMIRSVVDEALGGIVASILQSRNDTFISDIEPSECKNKSISTVIYAIKKNINPLNGVAL
ncbi:protein kinase domain-containing protein [Kosakonia sp. CFBP8986]|uniref:protein kinase domain-containing protein n=1 Tax=Kosakonia sp. CFBP8986 TaxID=3096524 RepID=UPI001322A723|nr:protein kinase [Kosakonia sp. CFBP8986]EAT5889411.1 hypothetical protein [Salmonella enterica]EBV5818139.1 hypothetical protein [Salmonella enterica subsp. enterica serovar Cubana]EAT6827754.1 hypothetical protein [Salmonella enterica]EAY0272735.1 hypothetical protein [Salmonella enterica]EDO2791059.1 protein kinase [Salmonella enterica]